MVSSNLCSLLIIEILVVLRLRGPIPMEEFDLCCGLDYLDKNKCKNFLWTSLNMMSYGTTIVIGHLLGFDIISL